MKTKLNTLAQAIAVALLTAGYSGTAAAAGFQLFEQSGSGMGNAFAGGAASAEDASTVYFNPAGMSLLPKYQVVAAAHAIGPTSEFTNQGSLNHFPPGGAATGGNGGNAGRLAIVPNLYFQFDPGLIDGLKLGFGFNTPFGLKTQYDAGWVGRYQALESELFTYNFNPAAAYRINDWISVGAGVNFLKAEAELSRAFNSRSICLAAALPAAFCAAQADGTANLEGDDWGVGYNLGVMVTPFQNTRIGLHFRSKIDLELEGAATFASVPAFLAANPNVANTGISAKLELPEIAAASIYADLTPQIAVMADVTWTNWSRFKELRVRFANGTADSVEEQRWDDSFRYSAGATYKYNDMWKFRAGFAFDETPASDAFRSARIPDEDRTWVTFGIDLHPYQQGTFSAGYAHIFVDDASLNRRSELSRAAPLNANAFKDTLKGEYDAHVDIFSVQYTHSF